MERRNFLLGSGAVAATALSGCLSSASSPADGGNPDGNVSRTISVTGAGEVTAEPDIATFIAGVEASGNEAGRVRDDLAAGIDAIHEALVDAGIDEDDISTRRMNVREDGIRYEGSHSLAVSVEPAEDIGEMIDVAVDAGADDIGRVRFTLTDETRDELREEAMQLAIEDAETEATLVANEVGESLGDVKHVDTSGSGVSPVRMDVDDVLDDAETSTEIHGDDVSVRVSIDAEYFIG